MNKFRFLIAFSCAFLLSAGFIITDQDDRQMKASLRRVGHELLLSAGDDTSRVLPVTKVDDRFRVSFSSSFSFDPDKLAAVVDSVMKNPFLISGYLVEMEDCNSGEIVYSYEMNPSTKSEEIPCSGRIQPRGCYNLLFTVIYSNPVSNHELTNAVSSDQSESTSTIYWVMVITIATAGVVIVLWRRRKKKEIVLPVHPIQDDTIRIGAYMYDKRNMILSLDKSKVELTGKESELLLLLHQFVNATIERDKILHDVWGDDGDYIGRTLDVFISRLRKKLEADSNLRIINIRGVGYKLVVNE